MLKERSEALLGHFTRLCTHSESFGSSSVPLVKPLEMAGHGLEKAPCLDECQSRTGASNLKDKYKARCTYEKLSTTFLYVK